jgi:hypothetical protein
LGGFIKIGFTNGMGEYKISEISSVQMLTVLTILMPRHCFKSPWKLLNQYLLTSGAQKFCKLLQTHIKYGGVLIFLRKPNNGVLCEAYTEHCVFMSETDKGKLFLRCFFRLPNVYSVAKRNKNHNWWSNIINEERSWRHLNMSCSHCLKVRMFSYVRLVLESILFFMLSSLSNIARVSLYYNILVIEWPRAKQGAWN